MMTNFKIQNNDLKEILADTKNYIKKLSADDNVEKSWYGIKRLYETINFVVMEKNRWEFYNEYLFNSLVDAGIKLKELMNKALTSSKSVLEIKKFEKTYDEEKEFENKNQNHKLKRNIEQYWRPQYEKQTNSIAYLNYYYDSEGYLVEIDEDGIMIRKDIRLAEIKQNTR